MSITAKPFGKTEDGHQATLYTLTATDGSSISLTDYGAHLVSVRVPDKDGNLGEVCLGYDEVKGYERNGGFLGATVGRYANRIGGGKFTLDGAEYSLYQNDGNNTLHGGKKGFDTIINRLQAQCYVIISDFVYQKDKYGKPYGWGIAEYSTPEKFMGSDFTSTVYERTPDESYQRILEHLKKLLPDADETAIRKILK